MLTIGRLARNAGVKVETVRFYERKRLLPEPPRSRSGYRLYPPEAVARIRFIRRAQSLGFSLAEIGDLLSLRVDRGTTCADVKRKAELKTEEIDWKIRDLRKMRKALSQLASKCMGRGPSEECPILEYLELEDQTKR